MNGAPGALLSLKSRRGRTLSVDSCRRRQYCCRRRRSLGGGRQVLGNAKKGRPRWCNATSVAK